MLAKKQFISDMKPETEAYLYNTAVNIPELSPACIDGIMYFYNTSAETAVKEMTLIACKKYPEAFCQYVVMRSCELFMLDNTNTSIIIKDGKLSPDGNATLKVYETILRTISSDPKKPAGVHNEMRLDFIKKELSKRMK